MSTALSTATRFRAAVERGDIDALGELLAPEVVFHSPVTFHPFVGRETVARLLNEVGLVFEDFRYTRELQGEGAHARDPPRFDSSRPPGGVKESREERSPSRNSDIR